MKRRSFWIVSFVFITSILFLRGCSRTVEQTDGGGSLGGLAMKAAFEEKNGASLSSCTVRFSNGKNSVDYQADQNGTLALSGLPSEGTLTVAVLDGQEEVRGSILLTFSQGAVIDATTSTDGMGHITVRSDTDEVSLLFILEEDGALTCTLWLTTNIEGADYGTPSL